MVKSKAGGGESGNHSGQPAGELDRDQFWIDLFAFATSPNGLGLDRETFISLSWKELEAHKKLWAEQRAMFFNANFSTDGIPFLTEDFLGTGNREARKQEEAISKLITERANRELQRMKPGDEDGVPLAFIPMNKRKSHAK